MDSADVMGVSRCVQSSLALIMVGVLTGRTGSFAQGRLVSGRQVPDGSSERSVSRNAAIFCTVIRTDIHEQRSALFVPITGSFGA